MKYRRHGVKREHSVLAEFASAFERMAALASVEGVIPGRIANNPTRHPGLVLKGETATGFKLLAKTSTSIQEVFVVVRRGQREQALEALRAMSTRSEPAVRVAGPQKKGGRPAPARPRRRSPRAAPSRPGVLPASRWQGDLIRFSASGGTLSWAPAGSSVAEASGEPGLRRRLWILRLRRSAWRRRFGVPARRVPVPRPHA